MLRSTILALPLCIGLAATARPDTIYLTDGRVMEGVTIESDSLAGVSYKQKGAVSSLSAEQVLRVEYQRKPKKVQEAEVALQDDNVDLAVEALELLRDGILGGNEREQKSYPWAAEWASARVIDLVQANQDWTATQAAAGLLIQNFPESRNLPGAYLAKAEAEAALGKEELALSTLGALSKLIGERSLPKRWQQELEVSQATIDRGLDPKARLTKLERVQKEAQGGDVGVLNRCELSMAEAYLQLADIEKDKRDAYLSKAVALLEGINARPLAEPRILAGAQMGLADARFQAALAAKDKDGLLAARLMYMRVAVLYRDQTRYVPKALFYAASISKQLFELTQDQNEFDRQVKLAGRLVSRYRGTSWANDAKTLLR